MRQNRTPFRSPLQPHELVAFVQGPTSTFCPLPHRLDSEATAHKTLARPSWQDFVFAFHGFIVGRRERLHGDIMVHEKQMSTRSLRAPRDCFVTPFLATTMGVIRASARSFGFFRTAATEPSGARLPLFEAG